ncbi:hypothetical protein I6N96_07930 [Enterococcus sp. BWM-S5]|uniref:Uncharacterized protein n=1 Tax=Enterococcus larvae TaxID=2794352 RepID=A0ABS4CJK8_9ENTE|nr:hypothetical protein [Enterococcus larvae]MBP1046210.1 hypothetical protein [Enterococcus larvae]
MTLATIIFYFLAGIGALSLVFIAWVLFSEPANQSVEPEYTEEEQFYASLLQQKSDLDADAFATSKAMMDEFFRHNKEL